MECGSIVSLVSNVYSQKSALMQLNFNLHRCILMWLHGHEAVGPLQNPLELKRISIEGRGPPRSYEMKVTLLEDENVHPDKLCSSSVQVAVTGGYMQGGYWQESGSYGIIELRFPESTAATVSD